MITDNSLLGPNVHAWVAWCTWCHAWCCWAPYVTPDGIYSSVEHIAALGAAETEARHLTQEALAEHISECPYRPDFSSPDQVRAWLRT